MSYYGPVPSQCHGFCRELLALVFRKGLTKYKCAPARKPYALNPEDAIETSRHAYSVAPKPRAAKAAQISGTQFPHDKYAAQLDPNYILRQAKPCVSPSKASGASGLQCSPGLQESRQLCFESAQHFECDSSSTSKAEVSYIQLKLDE